MNLASTLSEKLLTTAFRMQASDIHFYPSALKTHIYFRIHGTRHYHESLTTEQYQMLLTYYKFIASMDIGEIRKPQNGKVAFKDPVSHHQYALRLSTLPIAHTESLAIRILPQDKQYTLENLFLFPQQINQVKQWMTHRAGLLLITGPTGSGKSTTLYALLEAFLKEKSCQAITLEDPIEKEMDDILQVQVNEKAGITYHTGLKAALRHDPDIIMVGEIRDANTAQFALEASLTGHLVISTLHAKNAAGTIQRLEEMGLKKSDMDQTLIAVAAIELLPLIPTDTLNRRAAILELLTGKQLTNTIWERPSDHHLIHSFAHLRKKAFAYGYISEEVFLHTET